MHLQQIASTIDVPIETLRQLNPQYKLDIIPATTKPYTLVLPQRSLTQYVANEPAILAKDSLYLKEYINPANLDKKRQERSGTVYTVKKGDTLGAIPPLPGDHGAAHALEQHQERPQTPHRTTAPHRRKVR